jgi:hypothetical protein
MAANGPDTAHQQQAFSILLVKRVAAFADAFSCDSADLSGHESGRWRFFGGVAFPDRRRTWMSAVERPWMARACPETQHPQRTLPECHPWDSAGSIRHLTRFDLIIRPLLYFAHFPGEGRTHGRARRMTLQTSTPAVQSVGLQLALTLVASAAIPAIQHVPRRSLRCSVAQLPSQAIYSWCAGLSTLPGSGTRWAGHADDGR